MGGDYWTEHAEIAVSEAGIVATSEQLEIIAGVIESAHEFYGQSMGHDVASQNFRAAEISETERLQRELQKEREKIACKTCNGRGRIVTQGPCHSSDRNHLEKMEMENGRLQYINATIRVNAMRQGATEQEILDLQSGKQSFIEWMVQKLDFEAAKAEAFAAGQKAERERLIPKLRWVFDQEETPPFIKLVLRETLGAAIMEDKSDDMGN